MSRWLNLFLGLLLLAAGALAFRLPQLNRRPMHCDEAVHAIKFRSLWENGTYKYDPNEYHGPSMYYATLPFMALRANHDFVAADESAYRIVTVFFGAGLILLLALLADGLGRAATLWAALLTALSPAMVFYSRYYIHEMLLLFFTSLLLGGLWRYLQKPHWGWLVLAGAGLGLMQATKETFVFTVAAMAFAGGATLLWNRKVLGQPIVWRSFINGWHLAGAGLVAVVISVVLFTSFFTNAQGPLDSLRTYLPWLQRAGGQTQHLHPWHYYLGLLLYSHPSRGPIWTEALVLVLALVGAAAGFRRKGLADGNASWIRFLAFYTAAMTLIYSLIPYKTPWCLLSFYQGMLLLAGVGAAFIIQICAARFLKWTVAAILFAATCQLGWQAYRASYVYVDDPQNPYVYSHTLSDIVNLAQRIENLSKAHPQGHEMILFVLGKPVNSVAGDYWPLPWYLRQFKRVGWWNRIPDNVQAPVLIVSPKFIPDLAYKIKGTHTDAGYFGFRPGLFFKVYVENGLWAKYLDMGLAKDE